MIANVFGSSYAIELLILIGNCNIHVKQKILVINETKQDKIFVKTKSLGLRKSSLNTMNFR